MLLKYALFARRSERVQPFSWYYFERLSAGLYLEDSYRYFVLDLKKIERHFMR